MFSANINIATKGKTWVWQASHTGYGRASWGQDDQNPTMGGILKLAALSSFLPTLQPRGCPLIGNTLWLFSPVANNLHSYFKFPMLWFETCLSFFPMIGQSNHLIQILKLLMILLLLGKWNYSWEFAQLPRSLICDPQIPLLCIYFICPLVFGWEDASHDWGVLASPSLFLYDQLDCGVFSRLVRTWPICPQACGFPPV